jgi:hypothetical protein
MKKEKTVCDMNVLTFELEESGFSGKPTNGGFVKIKIKDEGETNMLLNDEFCEGFEFTLYGDAERRTLLEGLEWLVEELKKDTKTRPYITDREIIGKRRELYNIVGEESFTEEKRNIFIELFPEIEEFKQENLHIIDCGKMWNVELKLGMIISNSFKSVLEISPSMENKYNDYLYELYPETLTEKYEKVEREQKEKKDREEKQALKKYKVTNKVGFGKYKKKTWLEVLELDRDYFIWLKGTTNNKTMKSFIETIL